MADSNRPEIVDLGAMPELGVVPEKMHAFAVRQDRFGEPKDAWQREVLPVLQEVRQFLDDRRDM